MYIRSVVLFDANSMDRGGKLSPFLKDLKSLVIKLLAWEIRSFVVDEIVVLTKRIGWGGGGWGAGAQLLISRLIHP